MEVVVEPPQLPLPLVVPPLLRPRPRRRRRRLRRSPMTTWYVTAPSPTRCEIEQILTVSLGLRSFRLIGSWWNVYWTAGSRLVELRCITYPSTDYSDVSALLCTAHRLFQCPSDESLRAQDEWFGWSTVMSLRLIDRPRGSSLVQVNLFSIPQSD